MRVVFSTFLSAIATLGGVLFLLFLLIRMVPVDPVTSAIGDTTNHALYMETRREMGLDDPLYLQFGHYVARLIQGDLGRSFMTSQPVVQDLAHAFPATLELATAALLLGAIPGIALGLWSAFHSSRRLDKAIAGTTLLGYSIPTFWLALMSVWLFYYQLGWLPSSGRLDLVYQDFLDDHPFLLLSSFIHGQWDIFLNGLHHILLPASLLGFFVFAYTSRMTRSLTLDQLGESYVFTAEAKGLSPLLIRRHVLHVIRAPLVTLLALTYGTLLEGAVMAETIFSWPGIGLYLTQALKAMDHPAILGTILLCALLYMSMNMLGDGLARLLDPRIRR